MKQNSKPGRVALILNTALPVAALAAVAAWMVPQSGAQVPVNAPTKKGTVEKIKVHGKSLEGNLEGDSPDRDVYIYLPPSYATDINKHYPVVYFIHGYGATAEAYWNLMQVPTAADTEIDAGSAREMILVHPDAHTIYDGSMYSNSPVTGNWEAFIAEDLVSYVDSHYRTAPNRDSRGLAGHSMGGYGTYRIGMKYPEVFSALYPMSSCCLMNNPQPPAANANQAKGKGKATPPQPAQANAQAKGKGADAAKGKGKGNGFANAGFAQAAAWAPNPQNPPRYFDMPIENGVFNPVIAAKYAANSPLVMVDQYVTALKKMKAIMADCGLQDNLITTNNQMHEELLRLGIDHAYETYEGTHGNRVKERFASKVLPFFSKNLTFPTR